jgi:hypothetical protein
MLFAFLYYLYYKQFCLSYKVIMLLLLDFVLVVKKSINLVLLARKNNKLSFYNLCYKQKLLVHCSYSILYFLDLYYALLSFFSVIS